MYSDVFCKVYNEFGWNYCPELICDQLCKSGFEIEKCNRRLLDDGGHGTAWFVIAKKKEEHKWN